MLISSLLLLKSFSGDIIIADFTVINTTQINYKTYDIYGYVPYFNNTNMVFRYDVSITDVDISIYLPNSLHHVYCGIDYSVKCNLVLSDLDTLYDYKLKDKFYFDIGILFIILSLALFLSPIMYLLYLIIRCIKLSR